MKYNYKKSMKEDIKEYLKETDERDFETLYNEMFLEDSITGNGSGSYTFSTYQAEENICHNFYLLEEACQEFGYTASEYLIDKGVEWADVTIRCYLLSEVLQEVLDELAEEESEDGI